MPDDNVLILATAHPDLFSAAKDYENMHFLKILVEEDGIPITGTDEVLLPIILFFCFFMLIGRRRGGVLESLKEWQIN